MNDITRRRFLQASAGALAASGLTAVPAGASEGSGSWAAGGKPQLARVPAAGKQDRPARITKACQLSMLPGELSVAERFALARRIGFEAIEVNSTDDEAAVHEMLAASEAADLPIHGVVDSVHWEVPLSSPDPDAVEQGIAGLETAIDNAAVYGASTVLLVCAVVTPVVSYAEAYERSQQQIRRVIPYAAERDVVIAVENVWNKFLLSPLEFARYIDEFESPSVRAYFDIGNVVLFGYPEDWIRTLGERIAKLHLKDFDRDTFQFVPLGTGDVDWPAVLAALGEIDYEGIATTELPGGDAAYAEDVFSAVERILSAG